ncbi:hypothetical protein [Nocardia wallacei]|uniref:hypothetical protein n=1 Tax=Nocardia wallacei TaxID=480035 RepID=UPI0024590E5B|nr:hypothetical protein [Nocardia wallacei]
MTADEMTRWIAAAKIERRAYRAWQRALPLAPVRRGPDQYGQPWFNHVDRLRTEHAAARAALDALTPAPTATALDIGPVDHYGWRTILLDGQQSGASVKVTSSGNVTLSTPRNGTTVHGSVEAALNSWNFVGMLLDRRNA